MDTNALLDVTAYAGRLLLQSGAETYRVEETMVRIAQSFGVEDAQSFVTTTGVMLSITNEQKTYSKIVRVQERGVDLHRIDLLNALARKLYKEPCSIEELYEELQRIEQEPRYSFLVTMFFGALGAAGFAIFFKGTYVEASVAFVIGLAIKWIQMFMERFQMNVFFSHSIGAGLAAFLAFSFCTLYPQAHADTIIISSIMLLVPGLAITNAIRDTMAGDYLSGLSRAVEAFLIAIAIAVGTGAVLQCWLVFLEGQL